MDLLVHLLGSKDTVRGAEKQADKGFQHMTILRDKGETRCLFAHFNEFPNTSPTKPEILQICSDHGLICDVVNRIDYDSDFENTEDPGYIALVW